MVEVVQLIVHCDGSCFWKDGRMGLGVAWFEGDVLEPFDTQVINKHTRTGSSNEAEYLAIINALSRLKRLGDKYPEVLICSDSQLVINQIIGVNRVTEGHLHLLWLDVHRLIRMNKDLQIRFQWVPREHPRQQLVDKLSKKGNPYFVQKRQKK